MAPTGSPASRWEPCRHRIIPAIMPDDQDAVEFPKRSRINDPAVKRRDNRGALNRAEPQTVLPHLRRAGLAVAADDTAGYRRHEKRTRRHSALFGPLLLSPRRGPADPPQAPL